MARSNLPAITLALAARLATVEGLKTVYAYLPAANSANLLFFRLFDGDNTRDPPLGAQFVTHTFDGAFTVEGSNEETVETNIQSRYVDLLDVMRQDMRLGGTVGNGHAFVTRCRPARIKIGTVTLPGMGFQIEIKEQIDGAYSYIE